MKAKTLVLMVALLLASAALGVASDDAQVGTWKLSESKSKIATGMPKNNTVVYEAAGDNVKVTVDGT